MRFCPTQTTPSIACSLCEKGITEMFSECQSCCFWRPDICFDALLYHCIKKMRFSRILSNMKAYVIVRGSNANITNKVNEKGPEIIYFQCRK